MNYSNIYNILPKVLGDNVGSYNPEHRVMWKEVMNELYEYHIMPCDNDMCEMPIHRVDSIHEIMHLDSDLDINVYFCNEDCKSYGLWSIRYDYRNRDRVKNYSKLTTF